MSRDFPDRIDVGRAAQAGRRYAGDAPLQWMPRVLDLLDAPEAERTIGFEIAASKDRQGVIRLKVRVRGEVPMTCQRTLKRYLQPIDGGSVVGPVASEAEAERLPDDLEPKLVPDGRLNVVELVEDELLLALPLVPLDPDSRPMESEAGAEQAPSTEPSGPFAELARLKKDGD